MTRPALETIGSWEAENVTVGQVEQAMSGLRRHQQRAAVRASVLSLVVVVGDDAAGHDALEVVYDLGARHPSRTIVIVLDPGEGGGLDAAASVHAVERAGRPVCFEDVVLRVRGRARHHLDSVVEPFSLPDLPLVVWLPSRLPEPGDPLLAIADRVVVDTRAVASGRAPGAAGAAGAAGAGAAGAGAAGARAGGAGAAAGRGAPAGRGAGGANRTVLPRAQALARRLPVADLSWSRLAPWRSLLAGLFEGPVYRPFLREVERVEVAGNYGPRHLLGGWLLHRLGLPPARMALHEADHVAITITAVHRDRTGTFRVERTGNARVIASSVEIDRGPSVTQTVRMPDRWPALALAGALTRMGRDGVYCEALEGAVELAGTLS